MAGATCSGRVRAASDSRAWALPGSGAESRSDHSDRGGWAARSAASFDFAFLHFGPRFPRVDVFGDAGGDERGVSCESEFEQL